MNAVECLLGLECTVREQDPALVGTLMGLRDWLSEQAILHQEMRKLLQGAQ